MNDEDKLRRYLLGDLPEAEMAALEEQYFADQQLFDRLVEIENRLVDQYARGQLSGQSRELFESHYLAHRNRRERAGFAAALSTKTNPSPITPERKASWWTQLRVTLRGPSLAWALSALCLVLLTGIIWFVVERRRLHQELAQAEAQRAEQAERKENLEKELAQEKEWADRLTSELDRAQQNAQPSPTPGAQTGPSIATLIFRINGLRSGEIPSPARLIVPANADRARLQLILKESDYETYLVVVQAADGKQIFKQDGLRAHKTLGLTVTVPAHRFANGDYILTLRGVNQRGELEDVSKSFFRVEKK